MTNHVRLQALKSHDPSINVWSPDNLKKLCLFTTNLEIVRLWWLKGLGSPKFTDANSWVITGFKTNKLNFTDLMIKIK